MSRGNIPEPGVPESFKVLIKELQSLALDVKVLTEEHEEITIRESVEEDGEDMGSDMEVREDMDFSSLSYKGNRLLQRIFTDYETEAEGTEEFDAEIDLDELLINESEVEEVEEDDEEF